MALLLALLALAAADRVPSARALPLQDALRRRRRRRPVHRNRGAGGRDLAHLPSPRCTAPAIRCPSTAADAVPGSVMLGAATRGTAPPASSAGATAPVASSRDSSRSTA